MRVVLSTWGKSQMFNLARQMQRRDSLEAVLTTFSRYQLRREGIAPEKLIINSLLHFSLIVKWRLGLFHSKLDQGWLKLIDRNQQAFIARRMPDCDVVVGMSGAGLTAGRMVQRRGGKWICDRASAHLAYGDEIMAEEFARFGLPPQPTDPWLLEKELTEYAEADHIVVPSEFAFQSFVQKGFDPSKLSKMPFGSDLRTFEKVGEAEPGTFTVCYCGQIRFRKGIPYLLEAFRQVRHPKKRLLIIGGLKPEIREYLKTAPLEGVTFLGELPRSEIVKIFGRANVFAIASVEEGMAMVQTEAMACNLPVVATFNAGATDVIQDGVNGFVVPIRSPEVMADRLQTLADDPERARHMGENARRTVENFGGWDRYGDAYYALCQKLTGDVAARATGE